MFVKRTPTQAERNLFADMTRRGRTEQGLTQEQLSTYLGCSLRWINEIEQGRCDPNWRDCIHLAAITGINPKIFAEEAGLYVPISTY